MLQINPEEILSVLKDVKDKIQNDKSEKELLERVTTTIENIICGLAADPHDTNEINSLYETFGFNDLIHKTEEKL